MIAPMLDVADVALRLNRSEEFVRSEIKRKQLRASKIGRTFGIDPADLQAYIDDRANFSRVQRSS